MCEIQWKQDCELKILFTYFLLLEKYREEKQQSSLYYLPAHSVSSSAVEALINIWKLSKQIIINLQFPIEIWTAEMFWWKMMEPALLVTLGCPWNWLEIDWCAQGRKIMQP